MKNLKILVFCFLIFLTFFALTPSVGQGGRLKAELRPSSAEETQAGKISLDIKGMDVIDVLKILAMRGNLNIVAGRNVRGTVTLFLKNVDVMDVLDIVLVANGLAYEKKGNIINVMTDSEYELLYGERSYDKRVTKTFRLKFAKAQEVAKFLNQTKTKIGKVVVDESSSTIVLVDVPQKVAEMEATINSMDLPTQTKTFILNYAKAKDMEAKIKESLTTNIGELKIDERMNKIIVTDVPEKLDYIERVIADFDERDKVVLIEAKIVQITLSKDVGYGINWNNIFAGIDTIAQSDLAINLSGLVAPTTFTYKRAHGATTYGDQVVLKLLEKLGKTDVLSTPRITVANNEEAKVLVGTKEAFVSSTVTQSDGTTTTADNVQFVDVGVRLSVTPTISGDGYITMKIKPEVSAAPRSLQLTNPDGSVRTSIPIVTTSEAETQLVVKDGTTIIMAGLMKDTRKDNTDKIPGLGDVPLLGNLFKSGGKEGEKTELVIFLTPHIIKENEDALPEVEEYLRQHDTMGIKVDHKPIFQRKISESKPKEQEPPLAVESSVSPENFRDYCQYVSDKINSYIQKNSPITAKSEEINLSFRLSADGSLKEEPRILSTVNSEMKDLLIKSVREAAPFFPFPKDLHKEAETFQMTIYFEEDP